MTLEGKLYLYRKLVRPRERFLDPLLSILYMSTFSTIFNEISIYLGLGLVKTFSGPSVRLGQAINFNGSYHIFYFYDQNPNITKFLKIFLKTSIIPFFNSPCICRRTQGRKEQGAPEYRVLALAVTIKVSKWEIQLLDC